MSLSEFLVNFLSFAYCIEWNLTGRKLDCRCELLSPSKNDFRWKMDECSEPWPSLQCKLICKPNIFPYSHEFKLYIFILGNLWTLFFEMYEKCKKGETKWISPKRTKTRGFLKNWQFWPSIKSVSIRNNATIFDLLFLKFSQFVTHM